ncbi:MAG: GumC family protein [Hyphomicrobiaceae bacterium]
MSDELPPKRLAVVPPDMADFIGIALRGWFWLVAGSVFGLIAALMVLSVMPPVYKSSARIMFERTTTRYMQSNKVSNEPVIEDMDTLGQTYVIPSESIVLPVVKSLGLADDPTFVGNKNEKSLRARALDLLRTAAHAMGLPEKPDVDPSGARLDDPEKIAADILTRNLSVNREEVPSVITISFSWKEPVRAATIVNSIVETYQLASVAKKQKSTKIASELVQDRVDELKRQAADAERALVEYRMANQLAEGARSGFSREQVTALQTHLTSARVAMAEAKARMDRVEVAADANPFTPDNDLTSRLRAQLLDLSSRANDIEGRVGKDHLAAVKVRKRMEEIREAIADEQRRISGTFGRDYEMARARYDELAATISSTVGTEGENFETQARLRELEGAATTLRNLYNQMLQHIGELSKVEAQPAIMPDARVLSRATPPSQTESSKKRLVILAGGSMMGLLLGCALVFGRSFPFGVFRSAMQVTDATGLPCNILPLVAGRKKQTSLRGGEYALAAPYSRFAETLRNIWASVNIAQRHHDVKVVCIVSSLPGEGKTTLATSLAAHGARHSNARILVIDADFHRKSLSERLAPEAGVGLKEALEQPEAFAKFVVRNERLNLDVLPCPTPKRIDNSAERLGSFGMQKLMELARKSYDMVIIEAPPIAIVVDHKMIAPHCDRFVFVVEWGKTSQRILFESLDGAPQLFDRILCVVLNKADPSALKTIERYKGNRFHSYYSEQRA